MTDVQPGKECTPTVDCIDAVLLVFEPLESCIRTGAKSKHEVQKRLSYPNSCSSHTYCGNYHT